MTGPDDLTGLWTVVHIDPVRDDPRRGDIRAWVTSIGVDVATITPALNISQDAADGSWRLHLSRWVLDDQGEKIPDHAMRRYHSEPLVIPIPTLPAWLTAGGT